MRTFEGLGGLPLKFLESIGVDAIIIADMGIFSLAKRVVPGLELRRYNKHLLQTGQHSSNVERIGCYTCSSSS